jgi:1,4-alpha-glucan branching enzyme
MKTSYRWRETFYEKILFMNTTQNNPDIARYSAKNSLKPTNFYCAAPRAKLVELAGDFNHWHPLSRQRSVDGWWLAQVQLCHLSQSEALLRGHWLIFFDWHKLRASA